MRLRRHAQLSTLLVTAALLALLTPASIAAAAGTPGPATSLPCWATAHHEDAFHSGWSCATLPAHPVKKWSVTLNGDASYPIIADGKVFVATADPGGSYGGWLYALNTSSGKVAWGPVPLAGTYFWFALTYGHGNVYVDNFDGTVTAYSASTGKQVWTKATDYFSGEPVAVPSTIVTSPVIAGQTLYVGTENSEVYGLNITTGKVVWHSALPGVPGGGTQYTSPTSDIAIGNGLLVVPTGAQVTAFG
jgi:outer membrane protein assembly factor BamB